MSAFSFLGTKKLAAEQAAEITKLKARVAELEALTSAESPAEEALKDEVKALTDANDGLSKQIETAATAHAAEVKSKDAKITELEAGQKDFDAKVEKAASAKLLTLSAGAGVPPIAGASATAKDETKNLSGLERTIAAFKAANNTHN